MSTRIFLSGGEVDRFRECMVQMKSKSVLMTYWDLQKHPDKLRKFKDKHPEIEVFLDSGAFTFFMPNWNKPIGFYRGYVKRYAEFIEKNSPYLHAAAELDIDSIVGEIAEEWRTNIFQKLNSQVLPIVFVWHTGYPMEKWVDYCQKYEFVGISSDWKESNYHKHMHIARQYLARVHVFGYTRSTEIQQFDFYSVDSTTWLLGSKYGETDIFNGKTISRFDNSKKDMRQRFRTKLQNAGLDWQKISDEEYYEVIKMNMLAFIEMEEYLSRANKLKAYWTKKLPPAKRVQQFTDAEIDSWMVLHGYSESEAQNMELDDKVDRLCIYADLQHGKLDKVGDWIRSNPDDMQALFGEDLASKVMDKSAPSPTELDSLRKAYNLTLLKVQEAMKRTTREHYAPVIDIKRRPRLEEPQEQGQDLDLAPRVSLLDLLDDIDHLYFKD